MKSLLYKIIYQPSINRATTKLVRTINKLSGKKYQIPPSGIIDFELQNGKKLYLATNQTSYLTKVIYWDGLEKFEYTRIFMDLINNCQTFVDIGANIGYYSLLAAKINPDIAVYSFEPAKGPLHFLKQNVDLNKASNCVEVSDLALSSETGKVDFYEYLNPKYPYLKHNLGGTSSLKHKETQKVVSKTKVKTITLDSFVADRNIAQVDLIKIDTEGTEDKILSKAEKTINRDRPIIICETLFKKIESELEKIMRGHDYLFFNHADNRLIQVDTIVREKDDGVRDCFFIPKEKIHLINKYL